MRHRVVLLLLSFSALIRVPAIAQAVRGSAVEGTVVDTTRAPIVGARVIAIPAGQAADTSTVTDDRGMFRLVLPAGGYTISVTADGFVDQSQPVTVGVDRNRPLEMVLAVAGVREAVTVTAPARGYRLPETRSATKTPTPLIDVPQSVTVVTSELIHDQLMLSVGDVLRYVPGASVHQGENNRDEFILRGNDSSANFYIDGVRDDVQYYRDLYNVSRVEVLKGPNALIFGRGGAGGVVNRIEKEAMFSPLRDVTLQTGTFGDRRVTTDLDQPLSDTVAVRLNGMFEDSDSFRTGVGLTRYGATPTLTLTPNGQTTIVANYEYLNDQRVADRGITSFQGRPVNVDPCTYYGNPADSHVAAYVNAGYLTVEQRIGALTLRNHTSIGNYNRWYQNFVPGAVSAYQTQVALTAYNNATNRTNLFNQTDLTYVTVTGGMRHTLLAGAEVGRQSTDNFRNTGYFNNATTSISLPFFATMTTTPVTFRQSATDANNHVQASLAATYVQDQAELTSYLQVVGGVRFDRFNLLFHDNRTNTDLMRPDNLLSPRAGIVVTPVRHLSAYGSYSVSYLPSSGDQFSSLTTITQQLKPEQFSNYEMGIKWAPRPGLDVTTAVYRLDRTNTRSIDPNSPTAIVQTGSQRTNGYELGMNGHITSTWSVAGGYAYQNAFVTSATTAAAAGAQVGQVPHQTFSLWNRYRFHPKWSAGVGVLYRSDMFAAIDDTVTLPGYTRVDSAVYYELGKQMRLQLNLENLFNVKYYLNADSNTNISPGAPRAIRIELTAHF